MFRQKHLIDKEIQCLLIINRQSMTNISAILIGFRYYGGPLKLSGVVIDLYHVYKYCLSLGSRITLIVDDNQHNHSGKHSNQHIDYQNINLSINKDIVDTGIYDFVNYINNHAYKISNANEFKTTIETVLKKASKSSKLLIYYSGHGRESNILLPDHDMISYFTFRNLCTMYTPNTTSIMFIMDCCNINGMNLPYKLTDTQFKLNQSGVVHFTDRNILLITSSGDQELSMSNKYGSVFTRLLIPELMLQQKKPSTITYLIDKLSEDIINATMIKQTVSAYASYAIPDIVPFWFLGKADVHLHLFHDLIIIDC